MRNLLIIAACSFVLACGGGGDDVRECTASSECTQAGVAGTCLPSPSSSASFCAYPDPACSDGNRWGVAAGDDLAETCVAASGVDGGVDAANPDGAFPDGGADGATFDARVDVDASGEIGMITIPAGSFMMGCSTATDDECAAQATEQPQHTVTLVTYQIDDTEVTQGAYQVCVTAGVCSAPSAGFTPAGTPNRPVYNVTWAQAFAYCAFADKRLPTEAEWEKAARGTDARKYPWGPTAPTCDLTNYGSCGGVRNVGTTTGDVSFYGVHDMGGNVTEFVKDFYQGDYYSFSPATDPQGPSSGTNRVKRGSSYVTSSDGARSSKRFVGFLSGNDNTGFRCAK